VKPKDRVSRTRPRWGRRRLLVSLVVAVFTSAALPVAAQASQTLSVTKEGTGTGSVASSPSGINCGSTCSFAFAEGAVVLLTGTPGANTAPVKWTGCDSITIENKCKVTLSEAKKVTATFALLKRKLTITKAGTGTGTVKSSPAGIECPGTCSAEYDNGTEVTLTGTAGANTEAVKWAGCTSVDGENKCKVAMGAAKSVTATFNLHKVELQVTKGGLGTGTVTSSPAGISCGATCSAIFGEGQAITLTGTPTGETDAVKWTGCDSVTAENKCVVAMKSSREVGALFNVQGPTLTITRFGSGTGTVKSSPAGIECGAACAVNFKKDQKVTLTGTPGLHTEAVKWAGCDEIEEGTCIVTMSAAREVTAAFSLEPQYVEFTVSLIVKGTGTGSVQSFPPGISCPPDCSQPYVFKTPLTLIATAGTGSEFAHWAGGSCSGTGPCERKINSDRTVNAVFAAVGNRTLTVARVGAGQGVITSKPQAIECGTTCSVELDAATKVALHAVATPGSTFTGWNEEGCSGTGPCKVLMNEARNVTATFTKNLSSPAGQCHVPRLKGKSLARARRALTAAHCSLGKIRKPKGKGRLVVRSSSPRAGTTLAAGARVNLKLTRKR
jgi:PASTA domain/Divergent InlB B-repeat domain